MRRGMADDPQVERHDELIGLRRDDLANHQDVRAHAKDTTVDGVGHAASAGFILGHHQVMVVLYLGLEFLKGLHHRKLGMARQVGRKGI